MIPRRTGHPSAPEGSMTEANLTLEVDYFSSLEADFNNSTAAAAAVTGYEPWQKTLIGASAGALSLVTIAGNLMVMISFKMDKQLQTISNYFLFSLAVADFIIGLISMPLNTVYLVNGRWPLGRVICDSWLCIDYLASNASVLNLLVISFDRYFSVTRPLSYRANRTTRKAAVMIFSAWGVSALVWPPWIIAWPYIEGKRTVPESECEIQFISGNTVMSIVTILIAFFVPVSVMIGLYVRVWWETVKRQKELHTLQGGGRSNGEKGRNGGRSGAIPKNGSKRSDSSDETAADNLSGGGNNNNRSLRSCSSAAGVVSGGNDSRWEKAEESSSRWARLSAWCASCVDPDRPVDEDCSSGGYTTPRSLETPVNQAAHHISSGISTTSIKGSSMSHIRDPYSTRTSRLRNSSSGLSSLPAVSPTAAATTAIPRKQPVNDATTREDGGGVAGLDNGDVDGCDDQSIYTILIRFPPSKSHNSFQPPSQSEPPSTVAAPPSPRSKKALSRVQSCGSQGGYPEFVMPKRVPSIQMLPASLSTEEAPAAVAVTTGGKQQYPRSLPITRRFEQDSRQVQHNHSHNQTTNQHRGGGGGGHLVRGASSSTRSTTTTKSCSPAETLNSRQQSACYSERLPLDAKLVPRQFTLAAARSPAGAAAAVGNSASGSCDSRRPLVASSTAVAVVSAGATAASKPKKTTSEKKQDRKAAKTLSAILLAFIVTWTPYSVLTVLKGLQLEEGIPKTLWDFSYYLCYINSTVNPVLYALCNAAFRRTYLRILTCRWGSRATRSQNRYYYG